jgi:hypothetical protein
VLNYLLYRFPLRFTQDCLVASSSTISDKQTAHLRFQNGQTEYLTEPDEDDDNDKDKEANHGRDRPHS